MPKPTFLFVSNSKYFHLTVFALRSLFATNPVKKALVYDIGLTRYQRGVIDRIDGRVEIISSGKRLQSTQNQDGGWVAAVGEKTQILSRLVSEGTHFPIVLADSDLVFLSNVTEEFDPQFSIQVTKRSKTQIRPDGKELNYIASFLVVNSFAASDYLSRWSETMRDLVHKIEPPFESYAQHLTTLEFLPLGDVGELDEDVVACDRGYFTGKTRAVHLKSMGPSNHREILLSRLRKVQHLSIDMNSLARQYVGWRFDVLRALAVIRRTRLKGLPWLLKSIITTKA